jgi:serine/threonine protein kinase
MRELPEGQGSYGCIVSYEKYKCLGDSDHPRNPMISKIMTDLEAFETELYMAEILKKLDPHQHNLIYAKNGCQIPNSEMLPCKGDYFDPFAKEIYVITMKSGGISIESFVDDLVNRKVKIHLPTTLHVINDILHGLSLLHQNGITHGDISPKNVTIASIPDSNDMKRAYIIDFGLSYDKTDGSTHITMNKDIENAFEIFRILFYNTKTTDDERHYYKRYFETPKNITSLPTLEQIKTMFDPPVNRDTSVARALFG